MYHLHTCNNEMIRIIHLKLLTFADAVSKKNLPSWFKGLNIRATSPFSLNYMYHSGHLVWLQMLKAETVENCPTPRITGITASTKMTAFPGLFFRQCASMKTFPFVNSKFRDI